MKKKVGISNPNRVATGLDKYVAGGMEKIIPRARIINIKSNNISLPNANRNRSRMLNNLVSRSDLLAEISAITNATIENKT